MNKRAGLQVSILLVLLVLGIPAPTYGDSPLLHRPGYSQSIQYKLMLPITQRPRIAPLIAVGLMGMPVEEFGLVTTWGGQSVNYSSGYEGPDLQGVFDTARANGLTLVMNNPGRESFQSEDGRIDHAAVTEILHDTFDGTTLLGDPAFIAFYLIDEACHDEKWPNLTGADMAALYQTVKAYDPRLPLMHNFGVLDCLETKLTESGGAPIVDIAGFTVTTKKTKFETYIDGFLGEQAAIATWAKGITPGLKVQPMIAVWESAEVEFPSETWVETTGLAVLAEPAFDGLMYYPLETPVWATRSLDDVAARYGDEIRRVFVAAE